MTNHLEAVERVAKVVAEHARRVDAEGCFPTESMRAVREAGLLGLLSAPEVGGAGQKHGAAARVVERLARECGSTAMITCMHYSGTMAIEKSGPEATRREIAAGRHLTTLAFSESGSRSQFWAPTSTAARHNGGVRLTARKSWVTSARHADSYVWSSRPVQGKGESTLWLVPRNTPGLRVQDGFDGLGLRGNESMPVTAEDVAIPEASRLGEDGAGLDAMLGIVMPIFSLCAAAVSVGLMESATTNACAHAGRTKFEHSNSSLADLPTLRAYLARLRIATDQARLLLDDTAAAIEAGRADAMLRVLECKAAAGESATAVLDLAMRVCGGAAFRKDVDVERRFRDARAGTIMAPTTDQLYDFIGKALCGMPVFEAGIELKATHRALVLGAVAYDAKVVTIWDGFKEFFARRGLAFDYVLYSNYERQVAGQFAGQYHVAWNSPLAWIEAERLARRRGRTARAVAMRDTDQDLTSIIVVRADSAIREPRDLAGRIVAVGAPDSPQATLLPLLHLAEAGLEPGRDFEVQGHDVLAGKHGDHIGGERDAVRALVAGKADAACMIDGNHLVFLNEGTIPKGRTRVLARTPPYDHCNMTVLDDAPPDLVDRLTRLLLEMSWEDPDVRPLLELEGLKRWVPGRVSGYAALNRAVDRFGTLDSWFAAMQSG